MLIDTHCHIFFPEYDADRADVIARAQDAGVGKMIVVGTDISSSKKAIALAEAYPFIFATVGLHPHEAKAMDDALLQELENLSAHPKVVAIGETGLDFYYNRSEGDVQQQAFLAQIALAKKRRLPLVIHIRDAWDAAFDILEGQRAPRKENKAYFKEVGSVLHCFTGDKQIAARATAMGLYVSFSGIVTFAKTDALKEAATTVDPHFLLIETDCPFLAPQGFRGKRNEPSHIATTAKEVAALRNISMEDLAEITTANANRLFGLPPT
ncbi:MAG: TatD family hydrolase [Nitrospirae bacterium]|nr:TatD family hydrolase [Candidatus Troglogloeales bacterium]